MSSVSCGIVGLPNVGKSTLFNALLKKQVALSANYPFVTIEPNVGVVEVPDSRLQELAQMVANEKDSISSYRETSSLIASLQNDKKGGDQNDKRGWVDGQPPIIPATVSFVDIAGLVKGAAQGEGLGNQFLSHIREVDVIVFVLRDFKNEDIVRSGSENPKSDLDVLKTELLIKDLEVIDKRIDSITRELKPASPQDPRHQIILVLQQAKKMAEEGKWLEEILDTEELEKIRDLQLLSTKKTLVVLNCDEDAVGEGSNVTKVSNVSNVVRISAKMEEDLASLSEDEQKEYLKELGVDEPGLNILIRKAYETLGLITFFTAGPKEVRAWTTHKGALAPKAAGVIHGDFERGFIAAEVIDWKELIDAGGWQAAKSKGLVKTIGKTEEIKDGMVVEFRFSV